MNNNRDDMFVKYDMSQTGKGKHLGYWVTNKHNDFRDLPHPSDFIDGSWDWREKEMIARWCDCQPDVQEWRGSSDCRLCDKINGYTDKSDGIYVFPAGFSHYIKEHKVKPPQEFIDHVLNIKKQTECPIVKEKIVAIYPLPDWIRVGTTCRVKYEGSVLSIGTVVEILDFVDDLVVVESVVNGDMFDYRRGYFEFYFEEIK